MSPEAQRIAIATACGFTTQLVPPTKDGPQNPYGEFQHTWWKKPNGDWGTPPDYLNSLDAMHEAEKFLTAEQMQEYVSMHLECPWSSDCAHHIRAATAPADQRAEAFLRTIGKWTDS